jgi:hypothetical protein
LGGEQQIVERLEHHGSFDGKKPSYMASGDPIALTSRDPTSIYRIPAGVNRFVDELNISAKVRI